MADLHYVRATRALRALADDLERAAAQPDAPQLVLPVLSRRALGPQNRADLCRQSAEILRAFLNAPRGVQDRLYGGDRP